MLETLLFAAATMISPEPPKIQALDSGYSLWQACVSAYVFEEKEGDWEKVPQGDKDNIRICVGYVEGFLNGLVVSDVLNKTQSLCPVTGYIHTAKAVETFMIWATRPDNFGVLEKLTKRTALWIALDSRYGCRKLKPGKELEL